MKVIETDRLLLRSFTLGDLDELSLIYSDPDVVRYIGSGKPVCRDETEVALRGIMAHHDRHSYGRWAVVFKQTGELVGYGGLRSFYGMPELVYLLKKSYWGRGLATEIAKASFKYGFCERQFERIIAMANRDNKASHRVMEKVGMTFEKSAHLYGMDIVCYGISSAAYLAEQLKNPAPQTYTEPNTDDSTQRHPTRLVA